MTSRWPSPPRPRLPVHRSRHTLTRCPLVLNQCPWSIPAAPNPVTLCGRTEVEDASRVRAGKLPTVPALLRSCVISRLRWEQVRSLAEETRLPAQSYQETE